MTTGRAFASPADESADFDADLKARVIALERAISRISGTGAEIDAATWNVAWGKVAVGTVVAGAPLVLAPVHLTTITDPLVWASIPGRLYRGVLVVRATASVSSAYAFRSSLYADGVEMANGGQWTYPGGLQQHQCEVPFTGDGISRSYTFATWNNSPAVSLNMYLDGAQFYMFDDGPAVRGDTPTPPSPPTVVITVDAPPDPPTVVVSLH